MSAKSPPTRAQRRFDAALTTVLVVAICLMGNWIARDHLALRRDLSEDQMLAISPAIVRMLAGLEDVLRVEAYFTGDPQHAPVQVAKSRLLDQLREYQLAAGGRLEFESVDPNASTEARLEATRLGIAPVPIAAFQGLARVEQNVFLGLVLRHRGRERVVPFVLPQNLEYAFASAVRWLTREDDVVVGLLAGAGPGADGAFQTARDVLSLQHRVEDVVGLAEGDPVPDEVDVLLVARPRDLHPRAAFAIDQYVQKGGRAILCVDPLRVDMESGRVLATETGLEPLLDAWGASLSNGLVWDQRCNDLIGHRTVPGAGQVSERVAYPYFPAIDAAGLAREHPTTANLPAAHLFWCHALIDRTAEEDVDGVAVLPGVERTVLLSTSERAWLVPRLTAFELDVENLEAQAAELLATRAGRSYPLAVALEGPLPSPFAGGAPVPYDAIEETLYQDLVREAVARGEEPPERGLRATDEPVLSAERPAHVVVVGDADWIADGRWFKVENRMLLENLVDWLALDTDLMEIRARIPRAREIRDLHAEEREERGIHTLSRTMDYDTAERTSRLETQAAAAAVRKRWLYMGGAVLGSLVLFALAALGARLVRRIGGGV